MASLATKLMENFRQEPECAAACPLLPPPAPCSRTTERAQDPAWHRRHRWRLPCKEQRPFAALQSPVSGGLPSVAPVVRRHEAAQPQGGTTAAPLLTNGGATARRFLGQQLQTTLVDGKLFSEAGQEVRLPSVPSVPSSSSSSRARPPPALSPTRQHCPVFFPW